MRHFDRPTHARRYGMAFALAVALAPVLTMKAGVAQDKPAVPLSVPDDWSSRHVIFSGPRTAAAAQRMQADPRYLRQWLLHNRPQKRRAGADASIVQSAADVLSSFRAGTLSDVFGLPSLGSILQTAAARRKPKDNFDRDWAMPLGAAGTVGTAMFPAKFSFDVAAAPTCTDDFVAYNTSLAGSAGAKAARTGTFTASSTTGTAVVSGTTLTASPGTAASQSTTITANGVASGQTITITNAASTLVLTASSPVAEVDRIAFEGTAPDNNSFVTVAGIQYTFKTANWSGTVTAGQCFIRTAATAPSMVSWLAAAITTGSANTGASVSTWQCGTSASQPSNGATVTGSTSPNVDVTAKIAGSTGFTTAESSGPGGNNRLGAAPTTTGTDGSSVSPSFQYWSGAAAASAAVLATNIRNAIGAAAVVGVGATNPSSGVVVITATATGLVGNSITVATTIPSGLTAPAFNGSLTGGTSGTTAGTTFSTSTDSATPSVNLAAAAAALASAINTNVPAVDATSASAVVTVTAANAGTAGNSIGTTETFAAGFTWAGTTLTGGTDGKPSIIAFNQLYSDQGSVGGFCNQNGPSVMWSYNTGTGTVVTSSVLSLDGTKIMYVENKGTGAVLHILRWQAGEGTLGGPVVPTVSFGGLAGCPGSGSCDVQIALVGAPQVTNSAPFYDYGRDALYVGDNVGKLHKFTPVLNGTLAEAGGAWPLDVHGSPATVLSSPVLDNASGNLFIGDAGGRLSYVRETFSSTTAAIGGTCAAGSVPCLGAVSQALGGAIVDSPTVDSSTGRVFAFEGKDATTHGAVYQFDTALTNASKRTAPVSTNVSGANVANIHSGAFDQTYLSSANGTGHLFVCGKDTSGSFFDAPAIHRITITNGLMNTSSDGNLRVVSASNEECSPVTEVYNTATSTDWIFFSVGNNANQTGCGTAGCLMSLNVTGAAWPPSAVTQGFPLPGLASGAASSGIVIDNVAASSVSTTVGVSATTTSQETVGLTSGANSCPATGCIIDVASAASVAVGDFVQIDSEKMLVTARNTSGQDTLTVTRAQLSTAVASHANGATVSDLTTVASATTIRVASTTDFVTGDLIQIGSEIIQLGTVTTCAAPSSPCFTGVTRGQLGTTAAALVSPAAVADLTAPQTSSLYFSFIGNSTATVQCNAATGVGCAVKLTQTGLR